MLRVGVMRPVVQPRARVADCACIEAKPVGRYGTARGISSRTTLITPPRTLLP